MRKKKKSNQMIEEVIRINEFKPLYTKQIKYEREIAELKSKFMRHQISPKEYYEEYESLGLKLRKVQHLIRTNFPNQSS
ncbi:hypothetical protein NEF87_002389 [Candidatus Lokiarchaeum ossiferum]|uniref:Uncharacterized protein n=1 Tax=Candidatus Lokiarchaeum ossiferum TaxID=2951803 RepID=A0ABY6HRG9_9ARCH|nr:hypothetical protein NEF87_002389 [Candidatus Lokiarchaeum sp. B-35]